ncbi:MAG: hypothetical protein MMC23_002051 [Stictis urceolatum]|nr:hypothetical protein [Stictis urceolata]
MPRRMACSSCRELKVKCDGGQPCQRCQRYGFQCLYVPGPKAAKTAETAESNVESLSKRLRKSPYPESTISVAADTFQEQAESELAVHRRATPSTPAPSVVNPYSSAPSPIGAFDGDAAAWQYWSGTAAPQRSQSNAGSEMNDLNAMAVNHLHPVRSTNSNASSLNAIPGDMLAAGVAGWTPSSNPTPPSLFAHSSDTSGSQSEQYSSHMSQTFSDLNREQNWAVSGSVSSQGASSPVTPSNILEAAQGVDSANTDELQVTLFDLIPRLTLKAFASISEQSTVRYL